MVKRANLIVIAETKEAGETAYPQALAIVTPRSDADVRGLDVRGAKLVVMGAMRKHEKLDELLEACRPVVADGEIPTGPASQIETTVFGHNKSKAKK